MKLMNASFPWLICPNCGSENLHTSGIRDTRRAGLTIFKITICEDCGYTMHEGFTSDDIIQKAKKLASQHLDA